MQLKPWMKVLCWLGLGLGTGFFAGYQVGCIMERRGLAKEADISPERNWADEGWEDCPDDAAQDAIRKYRGEDIDGDSEVSSEEHDIPVEVDLSDPNLGKKLQIDDENVASLPYPITEDEFNRNEQNFEIKTLDYYEGDEVLHDPEKDIVLTEQEADGMLGRNALTGFGGDPNNPTEVLYICNEMEGTLYYVGLVHGAFNDTTEYAAAPQEEPGEERGTSEDDEEEYYEVDEDEEKYW